MNVSFIIKLLGNWDNLFVDEMSNLRYDVNVYGIYGFVF